jgi:hypothetical protein
MRPVLVLVAPLLMASTLPSAPLPTPLPGTSVQQLGPVGRNCRGRIETVRDERDLPKLRHDDAAADKPLLILAVDKTIDGCEVLVMKSNSADIRPLPEFRERPAHLQPLR